MHSALQPLHRLLYRRERAGDIDAFKSLAALSKQGSCIQQKLGILHDELPGYLHEEGNDRIADQAEAASLYGEYAIDFAAQAMRHALLAALSAIDLQMSCEEAAQKPAENER